MHMTVPLTINERMSIMHEHNSQQESTAYDMSLGLLKRKGFKVPRVCPAGSMMGNGAEQLEHGGW